jgi:hypothetical protein
MIPNSLRLPNISLILVVVLILALPACGSGDLVLPGGPPSELSAVSGDGQNGPPGTRLPDPLVVEVTDAEGRHVPGTSVQFTFAGDVAGGAVTPGTAITDDQGRASAEVQLGTVEGDQPVEALVTAGADSALRTRFNLTAVPVDDGGGGGGAGGGGSGGNGGGGGGGGDGGDGGDGGHGHDGHHNGDGGDH